MCFQLSACLLTLSADSFGGVACLSCACLSLSALSLSLLSLSLLLSLCAGTAVVVCSVGSLTYKGNRRSYVEDGAAGSTALELYTALTQLQTGQAEDPFGWVYKVC